MADDPTHRDAYLDLIKRSVTNYLYLGGDRRFDRYDAIAHYRTAQSWTIEPIARPFTLLGRGQLDLLEELVLAVERDAIPGDYVEAGVWRGGAIILMRALVAAHDIRDRRIIAADSFGGIPQSVRFRHDAVNAWPDRWVASLDEARQALDRYGFADDVVEWLPGLFADTLPGLGDRRLALIRLDSDAHDSIETSLEYLYPLLSRGGIVIVDDWHLFGCRIAVEGYRAKYAIDEPILTKAGNAYWIKRDEYRRPVRTPGNAHGLS